MKTYWGMEVQLHAFFDLGSRWRWVVSFTPRPLCPQEKNLRYPSERSLDGPQSRSGDGGEEKNLHPLHGTRTPDYLARRPAIPAPTMEQGPSWKADSNSAFMDWKVDYCIQKAPLLVSTLSQMNPVHITQPYFPKIQFYTIFPYMPRSSEWLLEVFRHGMMNANNKLEIIWRNLSNFRSWIEWNNEKSSG
jgi:hypothetical protein